MSFPKRTRSLCPVCMKPVDAVYQPEGRDIFLEKQCPEHGRFRTIVWRGPLSTNEWSGGEIPEHPFTPSSRCPLDCGACEAHEAFG